MDVTVLNRSGNPVTSLTAADFEVRDNGQLQEITSFKLVEATGQAPDNDVSLEIRHPGHAAVEAARDDVRVFLIFWDEYHINPFVSALRGREDLTRIVLSAFGPTDLVAIMDPLLTIQAIRFTRDRRELAEQVRKLVGRRGVVHPLRSGIEEAHVMTCSYIERIRDEVSVSAIKAAAVHLATLREGRKSLIVVSERLEAPSDRLTTWFMPPTTATRQSTSSTLAACGSRGGDRSSCRASPQRRGARRSPATTTRRRSAGW